MDSAGAAGNDAPSQDIRAIEQQEEEKLRMKFPNLKQKGPSSLLQKRLHQKGGRQFFDSGDYQMAKAKLKQGVPGMAATQPPPPLAVQPPSPEEATPPAPPPDVQEVLEEATGHEHPTPEDVPHVLPGPKKQRKTSVHGQSKLTTSPTADVPCLLTAEGPAALASS